MFSIRNVQNCLLTFGREFAILSGEAEWRISLLGFSFCPNVMSRRTVMARGTRDENAADKTPRVSKATQEDLERIQETQVVDQFEVGAPDTRAPATGDPQAPDFPSSVGGWVEASKERARELAEVAGQDQRENERNLDEPEKTVLPNGDEVKVPGEYAEGEKVGYELGGGWRGNVTVLTDKGAEVVGPDRTVLREAQSDDPKSA
jgi:hypothetical protein